MLVEFRGGYSKTQPDSRGKILVLSSELLPQKLKPIRLGISVTESISSGVTSDRQEVLFWTSKWTREKQECLVFSGKPLIQTGTCAPQDLNITDPPANYWKSGWPLLPRGYQVWGSAGSTVDGARLSLIGAKVPGACDLWGLFCPSNSRLIVFDAATNRAVFRMKLPKENGRAALSPNGKHLATLEHDRLEVFALCCC